MEPLRITLMVTTSDLDVAARTAERFAATAIGLAAEGARAMILTGPDDDDDAAV